MKTEIAKDIERAGVMVQYDAQCKKVLSNKYILAWIMQTVVGEFSQMTIDEIYRCIEADIQVGTVSVSSGTTTKEKIEGLHTEDKDAEEGSITYDIHFAAYAPASEENIKILINVEAQQNFYPGYPIVTRSIYYGARMISSQNGVEFMEPDYGDIKKVYSIWICENAPRYIGNAISVYSIEKEDIEGSVPEKKENYDKLAMVIIYLNQKVPREKGFFDMMNVLLSPKINVQEKKSILQNEYRIPMERGLIKEVMLMCNLSQWVLQMGIEEGIEQGIEQGIEKGIERGIKHKEKSFVENLIREGFTDAMIMKLAEIDSKQLDQIKAELLCMM